MALIQQVKHCLRITRIRIASHWVDVNIQSSGMKFGFEYPGHNLLPQLIMMNWSDRIGVRVIIIWEKLQGQAADETAG